MFSRSTAPAHCARGRDSIGRHCRRCPISSSASTGLSTDPSALGLVLVLGLEQPHLLVEASGHALELIDGGIVLLHLDALHVIEGLFLFRARLVADLTRRAIVLELDAGDVGLDCLVVFL